MSGTKHIAIWGAWYGSRNVGDQILLLTIMDILAFMPGNVHFTVFTDDPEHVSAYTSRESKCQVTALHNRRQFLRLVFTLATCDLFVFGGGVPFFEERKHVLVMALLVGLARFFRTPYMTWTVSSQAVRSSWAKKVFGWVLRGASAITYRDQHTHSLFQDCGVQRPMQLAGDPGFWLEPAGEEVALEMISQAGKRVADRPLVALTPRTLRSQDGEAETHYDPKTPAQYEQEIDCFVAATDWLWEAGYQPIFVPMNTVPPDDDRLAAHQVIQLAKCGNYALLVDGEIRPRVAPKIYEHCQASFVARVHGSITSFLGLCPPLMYAFAPKHAGIMDSMGLHEYILNEAVATPERTIQLLSEILKQRENLQPRMKDRLEILRQEALIPAILARTTLDGVKREQREEA